MFHPGFGFHHPRSLLLQPIILLPLRSLLLRFHHPRSPLLRPILHLPLHSLIL
ncbi:hypothetical protein LINPERHAP2_LOCUS3347 [Linum perenne]